MQKKILADLIEAIVTDIATTHNLEEGEARALVVIALKKNRAAFLSAVHAPTLVLDQQPQQS